MQFCSRLLLLSGLILGSQVGSLSADEIRVDGTTLTGKVIGMTPGGIVFQTDYGSGELTIPFSRIEEISSHIEFTVLFGDTGRARGIVRRIVDGQVELDLGSGISTRIDPATIVEARTQRNDSWHRRLKTRFRFWRGQFDIGASYSDRTIDESQLRVALELERKRSPTRFLLAAEYLYGKEDPPGSASIESDNQLTALVRGEYNFSPRLFAYVSNDFENDQLEQLSLRWVAKGGPGYKFVRTDTTTLQGEIGVAYVHRNFHGSNEENYASAVFGVELDSTLFGGHRLQARADYLPSFDRWTDKYVIRGSASYSIPIQRYLTAKWTVSDVYDNQPEEDTQRNEFAATFSLSFRF